MKYSTKNIFVDTNIIERSNFFHGSDFLNLLYYSRIGVINLYMTTISKMELIDRMKKRLIVSRDEHNKLINSLNKHEQRILKNLGKYSNLEKSHLKIDDSLKELVKKLELNIKTSNVNIINADSVEIEEVFDLYYQNKPPFSSKDKKKFEFPDAFILKSVENWCRANKKKMFFLTHDKDFNGYKSRHILFRSDIRTLLSNISSYYDSLQKTQIIPFIKEQIQNNRTELNELLNEEIQKLLYLDIDYEKVTKISHNARLISEKTTAIHKNFAEVSCELELKIEYTVLPSVYDLEREIFSDKIRPKKINGVMTIPCDLEVGLNKKNNIKIKWINSNQRINIKLNH